MTIEIVGFGLIKTIAHSCPQMVEPEEHWGNCNQDHSGTNVFVCGRCWLCPREVWHDECWHSCTPTPVPSV